MNKFILKDGQNISSIEELVKLLPAMSDDNFNFHANKDKNDFSNWIRDVFKNKTLADAIIGLGRKEMAKKLFNPRLLKSQAVTKKIKSKDIDLINTQKTAQSINSELILVLNAGSSSLKFELMDVSSKKAVVKGNVDGITLETCKVVYEVNSAKKEEKKPIKNYDEAVQFALSIVEQASPLSEIKGVGHRVVHGGEYFHSSTIITDDVVKKIDELSLLAPLHNPPNLQGILSCRKILPNIPEVAVFDTAFHATLPKEAYMYGIPMQFYDKYKIRRYGFHGTSHNYVYKKACELTGKKLKKVITCHLGNGDSITAILGGKSIDTSMGLTPLQGLLMGTRSGDIDPEIVAFLSEKENMKPRDVINLLNKKSGLVGISGYSDMRAIHEHIGEEKAKLAFDMARHRLIHYIGGYIALMNGVDAIIFTAGIGEGAYYFREKVIDHFTHEGIKLDKKKNDKNELIVSTKDSAVLVMVVPTNEELEIAMQTHEVISKK